MSGRGDQRLALDGALGGLDHVVAAQSGLLWSSMLELERPGREDAGQVAVLELLGRVDRVLGLSCFR